MHEKALGSVILSYPVTKSTKQTSAFEINRIFYQIPHCALGDERANDAEMIVALLLTLLSSLFNALCPLTPNVRVDKAKPGLCGRSMSIPFVDFVMDREKWKQ
jgi:hypothetical protein